MHADRRHDFLFTTWEGGGNVPPVLGVVRKLIARGHAVRVMSDKCNRDDVRASGAEFVPWTTAPSRPDKSPATDVIRDWEARVPEESLAFLRDRIMCGPALEYARDTLAAIESRRPDLVVTCEMLMGVLLAAEVSASRCIMLGTNISLFPMPGIPPIGPGLLPATSPEEKAREAAIAEATREMMNGGLPALNSARAALGRPAIRDLSDQLAVADRYLLATSPAFDFPAGEIPPHVRYVGPQLDDPPWVGHWSPPWPTTDTRPLVLVSFSTTFQDQVAALQRVIDALTGLPVKALVTLGPALERERLKAPENVYLCGRAPHSVVMREAAVVVTHCGHGTVTRALASGAALLCIPMGRDQNDNAARVVARHAGLSLPPMSDAPAIRAALSRLLAEPGFRAAAQRLGRAIADDAANTTVVPELEAAASGVLVETGTGSAFAA